MFQLSFLGYPIVLSSAFHLRSRIGSRALNMWKELANPLPKVGEGTPVSFHRDCWRGGTGWVPCMHRISSLAPTLAINLHISNKAVKRTNPIFLFLIHIVCYVFLKVVFCCFNVGNWNGRLVYNCLLLIGCVRSSTCQYCLLLEEDRGNISELNGVHRYNLIYIRGCMC